MAIELSPNLQMRIQKKIDEGEYADLNEVIAEGLNLIDSRKEKLETLRALIAEGVADVEAGRVVAYNEEFRENARRRAVQRVQNGERPAPDVWP